MQVKLYMATSIDGLVATPEGNTDWVNDDENFEKEVRGAGVVVMGRKTYAVFGDDFPLDGALNIVMTKDKKMKEDSKNVIFTGKSPREVVKLAQGEGFDRLLLIGGGSLNNSFLEEDLIDEITIVVHPIILGDGLKLFEGSIYEEKLRFREVIRGNRGLVFLNYEMVR